MEKRAGVLKANPNIAPKDVMTKLAELWKKADESTKNKFQAQSDAEKAQLAKEAAA